MRHRLFINPDNSVDWLGVDTGKTTIVAHNKDRKIIALKIAGHMYSSMQRQNYAPASFTVYEYELIAERDGHFEIEIDRILGVLRWDVRGKK